LKIALAFSGGKDSWACLWLNKDRLNDIVVIWVNTGKNYPEMLATIELAKSVCPNFGEITVDRDGQNAYYGIPADVVPVNWTVQGQEITHKKEVTIQPYMFCCYENIGSQLHKYCKERGITELIRGQRNDEAVRGTSRDGMVVDGITYRHPIEDWTSEQVLDFNAQHMDIPDHFRFNHTSMDCYDCTGFSAQSKDRIEYTKEQHPALYAEYAVRKSALDAALKQAMEGL
jgi:phosphoadenosine phosphosulfate reductase